MLILGSWLGTRLLLAAPPEPFLLVLALVMVVYLNLDRLGRGSSRLVQHFELPLGMAFGFVAGLFESIANVAGPMLACGCAIESMPRPTGSGCAGPCG